MVLKKSKMLVSVIINSKNEEKNIENCLRSIRRQSYPEALMEIIVVDNNSSDRTQEIARKYTHQVFNFGPERSAQKNYGARRAQGHFLFFLDADMSLGREVIRECVEKITADRKLSALYIPEIIPGKSFWNQVRNLERSFYNGTVIDGVRFVTKEKFWEVGGFDERLYAFEDWDLDKKLKKKGELGIIRNPLYHNERDFRLGSYLGKKKYYLGNLEPYRKKWGKNDPDLKRQFGLGYRFFGVFIQKGQWLKLLKQPGLSLGLFFLRFLVGVSFLMKKNESAEV